MGIKTDAFITEIVTSFYEQLTTNDVYVFGSDYNASNTSINSNYSIQDVLEKTIFGLRIEDEDVAYMIRNNVWAPGIVYDIYDDQSSLVNSNFFVIVVPDSEDGDYEVFKCIFNNNGSASQSKPIFNEDVFSTGGDSNLADGYVWRYMYTVDSETARKFKTTTFFPIVPDEAVANVAVDGINAILVENFQTNFGYERVSATANTVPDGITGRMNIVVNEGFVFEEAVNNYANMIAYVTKSEDNVVIASKQYVIKGSGKANQEYYIEIEGYVPAEFGTVGIERNDQIEILPRIIITGTGTGAEAIPVFDATNTRINSVRILARGSGYTSATAQVISNTLNYFNTTTGDVIATLRPIISPRGGHGSNVVRELRSEALCIAGAVNSQLTDVPGSGTYSKIAFVYEPIFVTRDANNDVTGSGTPPASFDNRVIITTEDASVVSVGETVSQSNGAQGIIHEIDSDDLYIINYSTGNSVYFTDTLPISIGAVSINITDVVYPEYLERSGEVLYISDFQPITRSDAKEETVKILVDF